MNAATRYEMIPGAATASRAKNHQCRVSAPLDEQKINRHTPRIKIAVCYRKERHITFSTRNKNGHSSARNSARFSPTRQLLFAARMSETLGAMPRQSLLEYFQPESRPAKEIACAWRRGYRMVRWSYGDLYVTALKFGRELSHRGIAKGDRVLIWGEDSGEWMAAFLGCMFCGVIAVPMDAIAEKTFARRVAEQAGVKLAVVGRALPAQELPCPTICLEDLRDFVGAHDGEVASQASSQMAAIGRDDPIEIVFTSGTTAEPRGVVLTHGNLLANLEPIEKEISALSALRTILPSVAFPRPPAAQPRVRPTAGNISPANSGRHVGLHGHAQSFGSDAHNSRGARFRAGHCAAAD